MTTTQTHFYMGAINKDTNKYVFPLNATKKNNYKCFVCDSDVLFKSGEIRRKYFCHKVKSNCSYYQNGGGPQEIHNAGKRLMKQLLDDKQKLYIWRKCKCCNKEEEVLTMDSYTDKMVARVEHPFTHNSEDRKADVALLDDDIIYFIFEIKYTSKTNEDRRPYDKWCEIDAQDFINNYANNINDRGELKIECVRNVRCDECEVKMKQKEERDLEREREREIQRERNLEMMERNREREKERDLRIALQKELIKNYIINEEKKRWLYLTSCGGQPATKIQAFGRRRLALNRVRRIREFNHDADWEDWKQRKGKYTGLSLCGGFGCQEYMKFNNYIYKNSPHFNQRYST